MTTPNPTPHDSFAQEVFADPEQAAVVLRAVLPPALTSALDFSKAKLLPSLFKDEELKERRADFLFEIPLAGRPALVLTLLEHQSRQDRTMAARLLVYAGRALDGHLRKHPRAKRLPALIPVVLYHGKRGWTAPRELLELYALDPPLQEALRGHLPNLRFFLDDLSQVGDDDLRQRPGPVLARLALIVLRHAERLRKAKDPAATLRSLAASLSDLLQQARDRAGLVVVFRYMLEVVELEPEEGQAILARALPARVKEDVVTAADQLEVRGMRRVLLRLLKSKFQVIPPEAENRLATAGAADLETWSDRVINASSLDEVFADPA